MLARWVAVAGVINCCSIGSRNIVMPRKRFYKRNVNLYFVGMVLIINSCLLLLLPAVSKTRRAAFLLKYNSVI